MEISKASIKLLTYLDCFQKFSIPYEEEIKSKEIKTLLDHLCGKNKVYNQSIFNDIIERIEEKEKSLTIKEYIRAVIEAEHFIGLKIKKLENIKINYKRLLNKLDANLVYLQDREKKLQHYEIEGTENFFVVDIYHGENFELLQGDLDFAPNASYLILKYFQAFKDTASQKIVRPVWNEKFRIPLSNLEERFLLDVILTDENPKSRKEAKFDSTIFLFNLSFDSINQLIVDIYDKDSMTGAQIRLDIQFRWVDFRIPIIQIKQIREKLAIQYAFLMEDHDLYINQLKCLLEPFDPSNARWLEFTYHTPLSHVFADDQRRRMKNIFNPIGRNSNIIQDVLLYSGVRFHSNDMENHGAIHTEEIVIEKPYIDPEKYLNHPSPRASNVLFRQIPTHEEEYIPSLSDLYIKNKNPKSFLNKPDPRKSTASIKHPIDDKESPTMVDMYPKNEDPKAFIKKPETKTGSQFLKGSNYFEETPSMSSYQTIPKKQQETPKKQQESPKKQVVVNSPLKEGSGNKNANSSPETEKLKKATNANANNNSNNNSAEKPKPVYHTKPGAKLEKQKMDHKPLVANSNFPHYVHPDVAKNKKYKSPQAKKT